MKSCYTLIVAFYFLVGHISSQSYFLNELREADPAKGISYNQLDTIITIHDAYLAQALSNTDTTVIVYAYSYKFRDYLLQADYVGTEKAALTIKELGNASNNALWKGWAEHLEGIVQYRLNNYRTALNSYNRSAHSCRMAGDSLCLGINLEQVGAMYHRLGILDSAELFYQKAWPIIDRIAPLRSRGATANNYGNLLAAMNKPQAALQYYLEVVDVFEELDEIQSISKAKNNMANSYRLIGNYTKSEQLYKEMIQLNLENDLTENLLSNYSGLRDLYVDMKDYQNAFFSLQNYIEVKDSLTGIQVQNQIAELEIKYKTKDQELDLARKDQELLKASNQLLKKNQIIVGILALSLLGFGYMYGRRKIYRQKMQAEKEKLALSIKHLYQKNQKLIELNEKLKNEELSNIESDETLYGMRILTDTDWVEFISQFEKAYPNYIKTLRESGLDLTPAEERLFLLLKLKQSRSEIATILGVSIETVKKTRTRLRSRIGLSPNEDLDKYVQEFRTTMAYAS